MAQCRNNLFVRIYGCIEIYISNVFIAIFKSNETIDIATH